MVKPTFTTSKGKTISRGEGPPSIFDQNTLCCNRPLGVCYLNPCSARKAYWLAVCKTPPGAS